VATSPYLTFINDVTVASSSKKTYSCYSELNSLHNVYFELPIFEKLTE